MMLTALCARMSQGQCVVDVICDGVGHKVVPYNLNIMSGSCIGIIDWYGCGCGYWDMCWCCCCGCVVLLKCMLENCALSTQQLLPHHLKVLLSVLCMGLIDICSNLVIEPLTPLFWGVHSSTFCCIVWHGADVLTTVPS